MSLVRGSAARPADRGAIHHVINRGNIQIPGASKPCVPAGDGALKRVHESSARLRHSLEDLLAAPSGATLLPT